MTDASAISREASLTGRAASLARLLSVRPLLTALLVIAFVVALRAPGTVDADVAWELWIGRQLNHGASLYHDIIEANPPLWFWMAMPVDRLSELVHWRADHVLILLTGCAAALAVAATSRLIGSVSPGRRAFFLSYVSLALVAVPWTDFAQREHIALIATLPYAALIARRRADHAVPAGLAVAIGVGAALGFALKHYFLIVPVLLEAWLIVGLGRTWRPIRMETVAVALVGILYGLAMLVWAQDYFTTVVPMLQLAYGATGAKRLLDLFQPAVLAALLSILLLLSSPRLLRSEATGLAAALTVAAIGFAIEYFIQAKGWSYHALPMLGCAAIALAATFGTRGNPPRLTLLAAPALLLLPFTIAAEKALKEPESARDVAHAVEGMRTGDTIGFIAADPSFGWHVILQQGFRFPSRYYGYWMMQAVVSNELRGGPDRRLTQLGRLVVRQTIADFECRPPRRIVIARPSSAEAKDGAFDILAFFSRDPEFAALLSHYRPIERTSVEVFERASPVGGARNCPQWSPV